MLQLNLHRRRRVKCLQLVRAAPRTSLIALEISSSGLSSLGQVRRVLCEKNINLRLPGVENLDLIAMKMEMKTKMKITMATLAAERSINQATSWPCWRAESSAKRKGFAGYFLKIVSSLAYYFTHNSITWPARKFAPFFAPAPASAVIKNSISPLHLSREKTANLATVTVIVLLWTKNCAVRAVKN